MTMRVAVALAAFGLTICAHAQVYKCPDASGRLSMQQTPCAGGSKVDVRPASGHDPVAAKQPAATAGAGAAPQKSYSDQLADERAARERWLRLNDAKLAVDRQRALCDREQAAISDQKRYSNNNLAGATRDNAISNEMQAAATACASRVRSLEGEVNRADAECTRAGCRQPGT